MPERDLRRVFISAGVILNGHFVYTSGRHGSEYLEKFRILENPVMTAELAALIADRFREARVDRVAGPTTGGIILAYEVARQLGVPAIYLEREPAGGRVLRRGFEIPPRARVLAIDDILTTGGSVREVMDCLRAAGGEVVGVGVLADRTNGRHGLQVPFFACLSEDFASYPAEACPLCAAGIPREAPRGSKAPVS